MTPDSIEFRIKGIDPETPGYEAQVANALKGILSSTRFVTSVFGNTLQIEPQEEDDDLTAVVSEIVGVQNEEGIEFELNR